MTYLEKLLSGSLLRRIVVQLAFWSMLIVLGLTAIGYSTIYDRTEQEALDSLKAHLLERGRTESAVFKLAAANMELFRQRFLVLYRDPTVLPDVDFDKYFRRESDGVTRMRPEFFDGVVGPDGLIHKGLSGFVGAKVNEISPELQRRLVLTSIMLAEYGPAWENRFLNTTISMPENAMVMYWPGFPWGREVASDLDITAFSVVRSTLIQENPDRHPVWTPLYHDHTANAWMVTYQVPIDYGSKHLVNIGHDVAVQSLMDRLITDHLPGSYNFVLAADGHLVAHPLWMDRLNNELATINLQKLGDPGLLHVYGLIKDSVMARQANLQAEEPVWIVSDEDDDAYLAVTRLEGPDWWFIARYPRALVAATAHEAARAIMLVGSAYFLAMLCLVFVLLRRQVAAPILMLTNAAEKVATGHYAAVVDGVQPLPVDNRDEIGLLARSFKAMAGHVRDANARLEGLVSTRTEALEAANRQLQEWSLHDGLTGAHNWRAFEMDLGNIVELGRRQDGPAFALVLADVDLFADYTQAYGAAAADQVLRTLVRVISRRVGQGDRVYRLEGSRAALILTDGDFADLSARINDILDVVVGLALPHQRSPHGVVTLSAGLVAGVPGAGGASDMLKMAEVKLKAAQAAGGNRSEA